MNPTDEAPAAPDLQTAFTNSGLKIHNMGIALYPFGIRLGLLLKNQLHRSCSSASILFQEPSRFTKLLADDRQKSPLIFGYTFLPI
jgi:hypothetical protein